MLDMRRSGFRLTVSPLKLPPYEDVVEVMEV